MDEWDTISTLRGDLGDLQTQVQGFDMSRDTPLVLYDNFKSWVLDRFKFFWKEI